MRHPILAGVLRALVLAPGVVPLGLILGAEAARYGFTGSSAAVFSATVLAGATQFAALALLGEGATLAAVLALVLLMNARYVLLSFAALELGHRTDLGRFGRLALALGVVEESYALQAAWAKTGGLSRAGLLAIPATLVTLWTISTVAGVVLSTRLPSLEPLGLDYALPGIFVGLFGVFAEDRAKLLAGLAALVGGSVLGLVGQPVAAALLVPAAVAYVAGRVEAGA